MDASSSVSCAGSGGVPAPSAASASASTSVGAAAAAASGGVAAGSATSASVAGASAASSSVAMSQVSTVYSSVNMMLGSIDSSLPGNELLKMAIALLILEVLMGKDGSGSGGGGGGGGSDVMGLLAGAMLAGGAKGASSFLSYSSTSISVEQSQSAAYTQQAYSAGAATGPADTLGGGAAVDAVV